MSITRWHSNRAGGGGGAFSLLNTLWYRGAGGEHGAAELPLGVSADLRKSVTVQSLTHHLVLYPVDLGVVVAQAGVTQVYWGPGSWDHREGEWLRVVPQSYKHDRNILVGDLAGVRNSLWSGFCGGGIAFTWSGLGGQRPPSASPPTRHRTWLPSSCGN